jgi:hypothetical protein
VSRIVATTAGNQDGASLARMRRSFPRWADTAFLSTADPPPGPEPCSPPHRAQRLMPSGWMLNGGQTSRLRARPRDARSRLGWLDRVTGALFPSAMNAEPVESPLIVGRQKLSYRCDAVSGAPPEQRQRPVNRPGLDVTSVPWYRCLALSGGSRLLRGRLHHLPPRRAPGSPFRSNT